MGFFLNPPIGGTLKGILDPVGATNVVQSVITNPFKPKMPKPSDPASKFILGKVF